MRFLKVILTLAIICTAYIGDYIVFRSKYSSSQTFRAFADSAVHASLGFLSSLIFFSHETNFDFQVCIYNVILCTLVSFLIDVDHAFVARSIYLKVSLIKKNFLFQTKKTHACFMHAYVSCILMHVLQIIC